MRTVLLVDDSATFRRVVSNMLKDHFNVVGQGRDGVEGLRMQRELRPDLILLDITMPNMNGKECLEAILKENSGAKVIMVSSLGDEVTVKACLDLGAKMFVNKDKISLGGLDMNPELRNAIDEVLGKCIAEEK